MALSQDTDNKAKSSLAKWGFALAFIIMVLDQLNKYYLVEIYRLADRGRVKITSFFDLVMAWNKGVSFSFLSQDGELSRYLLIAFTIIVIILFSIWMSRMKSLWPVLFMGMIIGGALGNVIDRINYGAVADFYSLHYGGFRWYIFNFADVAIVIGAIGLVFTMFQEEKP